MTLPLSERRESILLLTLMALQFTVIVDFMIMMPLSVQLMAELHIQPAQFGLLVSAYSLAAGTAALIASSILDRFDRRKALLVAYAGLLAATLGCGLVNSYGGLLAARMVAGIFGGVLSSIVLAIVGDVIPVSKRGRATGIVMLAFSLAAIAGVPLGLFIAHHFHWQSPFRFLVLAGLPVLVLAWFSVPPVREHLQQKQAGFWDSYYEILSEPNHWWAFATSALLMFGGFLVIPYLAPTLVANADLAEAHLPYLYLVGGAVTLITRPWIGGLTDRHRHADVMAWIAAASFVPIVLITHSPRLALPWHLLLTAVFFIFVSGRFIPCMALVTSSCTMQARGRVMAFNSAVQNLGSGLAALIAGAIMTKAADGRFLHYDWVGYISCICGILAVLAARRVRVVS